MVFPWPCSLSLRLWPASLFIPKLDEDNARQGFLDHAVYLKLRDALPQHLKAIFVVAYHVGMRIGELRKIEWSQVDLKAGEIRIEKRQAKGKKSRTIPIYGDMRAWLEMQKAQRDQKWPECRWVFHYLNRPIGSHVRASPKRVRPRAFLLYASTICGAQLSETWSAPVCRGR